MRTTIEAGRAKRLGTSALLLRGALAALSMLGALPNSDASENSGPPVGPIPRHELINAIKDLEKTLGFKPTNSFSTQSNQVVAYYRCYYTGKLELPESYDGLQLKNGTKDGCAVDPAKYDVFFYPMEASANGKSPLTASLANSSTERLLVVVPHEDFHENRQARKLPAALDEAASTLIGFLAAREVAQQKFGVDSEMYRSLSGEAELFLRKAAIVNRAHAGLRGVYAALRSGEISKPEALALKARFFAEAEQECKAISPNPKSFNKCLSADNNAGLAFDRTYTEYYPLMYELFASHGEDLKGTIDALKQALSGKPASEVVLHLQSLVKNLGGPSSR
jgi:hypothetical protein